VNKLEKLKTGLMLIDSDLMGTPYQNTEFSINTEDSSELLIIIDNCEDYPEEKIEKTERHLNEIFKFHLEKLKTLDFKWLSCQCENNDDRYLLGFYFQLQ
jgi:hypothetical protein